MNKDDEIIQLKKDIKHLEYLIDKLENAYFRLEKRLKDIEDSTYGDGK